MDLAAEGKRSEITWTERFSGKSDAAETSGFGSRLIRTLVEMQPRGSLMRSFRQGGMTVMIDLPRSVEFGN